MPPANLAASRLGSDLMQNGGETVFGGLLLAVIGGRRPIVLIGKNEDERRHLLGRLAHRLQLDGMLVLTVGSTAGVRVEGLIDVAGRSRLGPAADNLDFDGMVASLEQQLDAAGAGILMVDNADLLSTETLQDLMELSSSTTPGGVSLQVLISGNSDLETGLTQAGLDVMLTGTGSIYRLEPSPRRSDIGPQQVNADTNLAPARSASRHVDRAPSSGGNTAAPGRRWIAIVAGLAAAVLAIYVVQLNSFSLDDVLEWSRMVWEDVPSGRRPTTVPNVQTTAVTPTPTRQEERTPETATPEPSAPEPSAPVVADRAQTPDGQTVDAPSATMPPMPPSQETPVRPDPAPKAVQQQAEPDLADIVPPPAPAGSAPIDVEEELSFRQPEPPTIPVRDRPVLPEPSADIPSTEPTSATGSGDDRQILGLLAQIESQVARQNLTTPSGDNALETLRTLAEIDPDHTAVPALRQRIVETYRLWARQAERRGQWEFARTYYQRALRVEPTNREVTRLLDGLDRRRAEGPQSRTQTPTGEQTSASPTGGEAPPVPTLKP